MSDDDDNLATAEELAAMLKAQAAGTNGLEIPPELNVFPTMDAAWAELAEMWFEGRLSPKQLQDARFIFYHGVQAAANLMIYCAGQGNFEMAADQITKDCLAYENEAEAVVRARRTGGALGN